MAQNHDSYVNEGILSRRVQTSQVWVSTNTQSRRITCLNSGDNTLSPLFMVTDGMAAGNEVLHRGRRDLQLNNSSSCLSQHRNIQQQTPYRAQYRGQVKLTGRKDRQNQKQKITNMTTLRMRQNWRRWVKRDICRTLPQSCRTKVDWRIWSMYQSFRTCTTIIGVVGENEKSLR